MPDFDAVLAPLRAAMAHRRAAAREADRQSAPAFNVFPYIRPDENGLSDIFADLCDPVGSHGQGVVFLDLFLRAAGIDLPAATLAYARVRREAGTSYLDALRRIDFTLEFGRFAVGVENKPWAGDQPDQVPDYLLHLSRQYGEGNYALIYLSGDGGEPASLPDADRIERARARQLVTLPFVPGLTGWVADCLNACAADRVRAFLHDLHRFIQSEFGEGPMPTADTGNDLFVNHALAAPDHLAIALGFYKAGEEIVRAAGDDITRAVAGQVAAALAAGEGWSVRNAADDATLRADGEWVAVTRAGWPDSPHGPLRAALCTDAEDADKQSVPRKLFFQLRKHCVEDKRNPEDALSNSVAEAANKACGRGQRSAPWWPHWYQYADRFTDWTDLGELPILFDQKPSVLDYFVSRLVRLALAVDDVIGRVSPD